MDIYSAFQQAWKWKELKVKAFNSTVFFEATKTLFLVVATDIFSWVEERTPKTIEVAGLGHIMHAYFVAWSIKNPDLVQKNGLLVGAIQIKNILAALDFSDANNPALWKRAHLSNNCDEPIYGFSHFIKRDVFTEEDREKLNEFAKGAKPDKILAFLHERYSSYAGITYTEFLRSQYITSVEAKK